MKFFTEPRYTIPVIVLSVALAFAGKFSLSPVTLPLSIVILIYFTFEAYFKIKRDTWRGYIATFGNKFDFSVLLISALFLMLPPVEAGSIAYLRVFRLVSLIRVVRLMPDTNHIIRGVTRALKASKAVLILIAMQLAFFSLLGFTLFCDYLPEYFGNPLTSLNTVFTIFTVENWDAAPEAAKALDQAYVYYAVNGFVIMVLVMGGFIALSLANAIFVDEMVSDNNDELKEQIDMLRAENREIKELLLAIQSSSKDNRN